MKKIFMLVALLVSVTASAWADKWESKGYSWSGTSGTETLNIGDVLTLDATLGKLYPAKTTNAGRAKVVGVAGTVSATKVQVVTLGEVYTSDITSSTIGSSVYASSTAGKFTTSTTSTQAPIGYIRATDSTRSLLHINVIRP